ncbi:unnamed protein product [Bursaphelenchus xylophilus]|uniref:(pine wood nematode) hypothetical protein n=1 Tax=Bursaphelenchus xylophilus TaxID=6326 RepID=A0A7I8WT35_BURXY|nr:unnamed protein product [Bursaphelenchus xylophilus]CAG9115948.1 unnamed protein product [Bursaphelenchus xylophilus]
MTRSVVLLEGVELDGRALVEFGVPDPSTFPFEEDAMDLEMASKRDQWDWTDSCLLLWTRKSFLRDSRDQRTASMRGRGEERDRPVGD